ncbi:hypothetical protein M8J77_015232 [Diaphorina citri]|nr:hypothetical protein M8J77_015232 [Diaphorina citri]
MSGTIGSIPVFDHNNDWLVYKEVVDMFMLANRIEESRKVPILLSAIGEKTVQVLRQLCDPESPSCHITNACPAKLNGKPMANKIYQVDAIGDPACSHHDDTDISNIYTFQDSDSSNVNFVSPVYLTVPVEEVFQKETLTFKCFGNIN